MPFSVSREVNIVNSAKREENIVVSIRGSLSIKDALTDMSAFMIPYHITSIDASCYVHKVSIIVHDLAGKFIDNCYYTLIGYVYNC